MYVTLIGGPWCAARLFKMKTPLAKWEHQSNHFYAGVYVGGGVFLSIHRSDKSSIKFRLTERSCEFGLTLPYDWKNRPRSDVISFAGFYFISSYYYDFIGICGTGISDDLFVDEHTVKLEFDKKATTTYAPQHPYPPLAGWQVGVPIWFIFLLTLCSTLFAFRKRRRERLLGERCMHCSYNLTGNISGVCPECGKPAQISAT